MQDLEELKKEISSVTKYWLSGEGVMELIARCESAESQVAYIDRKFDEQEKEWALNSEIARMRMELSKANENYKAEYDCARKLESELKELREQKQYPIGQFTGHFEFKNNQAHINVKCFDEVPTVGAYLYSAPESVQDQSVIMQWREIGESDWEITTDSYWFASCEKSPEHDTRKLPVAQSRDSAEPSDHVLMPKSLTAENGAKSLFMGGFNEQVEMTCPECADCNDDEDCIVCDGSGQYIQKVPVSWSTVKDIYAMAVSKLAASPQSNANSHSDIEQSHMAGQISAGVDPSYSSARAYAHSEPFPFIPWSKEAEMFNAEALAKSQKSPAVAVPSEVKEILQRITTWHGEFPEPPLFNGNPQSFGAAYGSNGERDYMRNLACYALALIEAAPQASAEQPENQCDGCNAGLHKTEIGMHLDFAGMPVMTCQKSRYKNKSAQDGGKV